jgi:hypothetical protein
MTIALDIGTRGIRSLRRQGNRLVGRRNLTSYIALPDTPGHRRLLEKTATSFARCDDSLLVIGKAAVELAETLQLPQVPLLSSGRLPPGDPLARQVFSSLIDWLVPSAPRRGHICWMALPGGLTDPDTSTDRDFFRQLVRLKGYETRFVSAALAVVLAQLGHDGFSGIGIDFGSGFTRASLAHRGVELATVCLPRGGHWIDTRMAQSEDACVWDAHGHQYLDTSTLARWKESSDVSLTSPVSDREQRLSLLYDELIGDVLSLFSQQISYVAHAARLPQPMPLVCAGGVARLRGFPSAVKEILQATMFPVTIAEIRSAADVDYTVARGCLILGELAALGSSSEPPAASASSGSQAA